MRHVSRTNTVALGLFLCKIRLAVKNSHSLREHESTHYNSDDERVDAFFLTQVHRDELVYLRQVAFDFFRHISRQTMSKRTSEVQFSSSEGKESGLDSRILTIHCACVAMSNAKAEQSRAKSKTKSEDRVCHRNARSRHRKSNRAQPTGQRVADGLWSKTVLMKGRM